jgi:hypothetical protein
MFALTIPDLLDDEVYANVPDVVALPLLIDKLTMF